MRGPDIVLPEIKPSSIERVRKRFLDDYRKKINHGQSNCYDPNDIENLVQHSNYHISRFLCKEDNDEDKALEALKYSLEWMRQFNLNSLTDESFPREFYSTAGVFRYKTDADGVHLLFMRIQMVKSLPEIEEYIKAFVAYQIKKLDFSLQTLCSWAIVFDCSNIGLSNVQLDLMKFLINYLKDVLPCGCKFLFVFNLFFDLSCNSEICLGI